MRRVLIALAILAVTALPSFAEPAPQVMHNPEMKTAMMRNPQHLLMMAYHRNVIAFGQTLAKAARQGDTVPGGFARTAIAEMRRSVDEMEKYRAGSLQSIPADMKGRAEMQKMMDEHLVNAKNELRQLEELAKSDRIPSQEVLKHLQFIQGCQEVASGHMHDKGMYCGGGQQEHGCRDCDKKMMAMPDRRRMMEETVQKMKAQDADLKKQVEKMQRAPKDKKVPLMANIVAQLVQQRAEVTDNMERMQKQMRHPHRPNPDGSYPEYAPPPPNTPMFREGEGPDDEDGADVDIDDMEMGDDVTE